MVGLYRINDRQRKYCICGKLELCVSTLRNALSTSNEYPSRQNVNGKLCKTSKLGEYQHEYMDILLYFHFHMWIQNEIKQNQIIEQAD